MSKYRVKAYFMHEDEQEAAKKAVDASVITDAEWTDGYVMGVVDEAAMASLANEGIVVSLVEKVAQTGEENALPVAARGVRMALPGVFALGAPLAGTGEAMRPRSLPVTPENRKRESKLLSHDPRRSQYYIVRFHGSITEERRKELRKLRVKLLERLTRNKYTVHLKPSEAKVLAEVPCVDSLRLYTEADTLRVQCASEAAPEADAESAPTAAAAESAPTAAAAARNGRGRRRTRRTCIYTVRLHQAKDMRAVVKWLASRKRKPFHKHADQLQVALVENSKIVTDLAKRPEVAIVERVEVPRLYDEPARTLLGLARANVKLGLDGAGEIIGIADTGIDQTHPDLKNRLAGVSAWGRPNDPSDPDGHGTHVAGCAAGDGSASNGEVMGAAPAAKIFFQSIMDANGGLGGLPPDLAKLLQEAYDKGARVHNNSWGAYGYNRYLVSSLDVDRFVVANPDMLIVIAAGNEGIGIPRAVGSKMSAQNGFVDWPCVASPATAKNGLTVGASRSSRATGGYAELTWSDVWPERYPYPPISQERISSNEQSLAAFSSRGPSIDWRVKPDVIAPGTDIAAAKSKDAPLHKFWGAYPKNDKYGFMGGTSMAAPYVAGCAALVREWYRKHAGWDTPSAALLKATLINGTQRIGGADASAELAGDPNFHQGFGRVDMSSTVPNPLSPQLKLVFDDTWKKPKRVFTKTGQRFRYQVQVDQALPLRVCLVWTDPAGSGLQHTLTLLADDSNKTKWVGNAQAPSRLNIAGAPPDQYNNVQVIRIDKPQPGVYTIAVFATNLLTPPQSFALVVTGSLQSNLTELA
ncbi:MAG: hypothetical protein QOD32_1764 [Pyrinomonadaceae bacterium]|jgi:subtilisin family serine protease|nr:hypothetical protein [Pyrinomonadaceae bacterium]